MQIIPGDNGVLGAQIRGVDLGAITGGQARDLLAAVHHHALVRCKGQNMSVHQYVELGDKLGAIMPYPDERYRHPEHPGVFVSSNVKGRTMGMARSGYFWHTDLSATEFDPAARVLLHHYDMRRRHAQCRRRSCYRSVAVSIGHVARNAAERWQFNAARQLRFLDSHAPHHHQPGVVDRRRR